MILIVVLCTALVALLLWALYQEPEPAAPARHLAPAHPLPQASAPGAAIRAHRLRLVPVGYDPRQVDAHLAALARAHDALRAELDAERGAQAAAPAAVPEPPVEDGAPGEDGSARGGQV